MISEPDILHVENITSSKHNERLRIAGLWRSNRTWSKQKHHATVKKLARMFCDRVNAGLINSSSTYQEEF